MGGGHDIYLYVWRVAGKRKKLGLESEGCLLFEQTLKKKTEETHELGVKEEEAGLASIYGCEAGCLHKWTRGGGGRPPCSMSTQERPINDNIRL